MATTVHPHNTLNALSGDKFLYATRTVLRTAYPHAYGHALRKQHGANKPPQLMAWLIDIFTQPGMWVLDPMAGVGGTLIGASLCETGPRNCVGIEIEQKWVDIYREVQNSLPPPETDCYLRMVEGDCLALFEEWRRIRQLPQRSQEEHYDFVCFDPPYNIHLKQTMSGKKGTKYTDIHANRRTDYAMQTGHSGDIANVATYDEYLNRMEELFCGCYEILRDGRYCCFFVQNSYQHGRYYFTQADLAARAMRVGFVPKGEIIWEPAGKRLRPYGYPYAWVPNPVHTTIVVLQKPAQKETTKHELQH